MDEELKSQNVIDAHAEFKASVDAAELAFRKLVSLAPDEPAAEGAPARKSITPDMADSARHVARAFKTAVLDALVVAQGLMAFTAEAREAAVAAQKGRFKIVDGPAEAK